MRISAYWSFFGMAVLLALAASSRMHAQSPFFPNTQPIYNNPYGVAPASPYGPYYRGAQLPLRPLPPIYSQPIPGPPPSIRAGYGSVPYNYGPTSNVRVFSGTTPYPPSLGPNYAPGAYGRY